MQNQLLTIVLSLLATLITLSVHEFSHAYAAYKLGDDTPKFLGRLTLNPLKHLDPIGALCMVFFHFGWAKPVPINPRNFKDGKKGSAIVSLAGPLSNLILAFILAFVYLLTFALLRDVQFESSLMFNIAQNSLDFLYIFHIVNVGIAIFNLIPIPPLDGSHILAMLLPPKAYFVYIKNQKRLKVYWV